MGESVGARLTLEQLRASLTASMVASQALGSFASVLTAVIEPRAESGGSPVARTHGSGSQTDTKERDLLPLRVSKADCYRCTPRYAKVAAERDSPGRKPESCINRTRYEELELRIIGACLAA